LHIKILTTILIDKTNTCIVNMMTKLNTLLIFIILSSFQNTNVVLGQKIEYKNPILSGFYPDPSICRVDDNYYMVNSSFEYFPGIPIWHSKDLVNWKQIGHCITKNEQINYSNLLKFGGIYAATIRYHNGTFYVVSNNVANGKSGGNFIVQTKDPASEWSDPIWFEQKGIDPDLFFDLDGKAYLITNGGPPAIYMSEVDINSGKSLTEIKQIWKGTGGKYPEGPHIYFLNDYYYLLISEGGTEQGHYVVIARSKTIWGPFEECPNNPILTHRDQDWRSPLQGTGHADFVQTQDGSWWTVFLAFRPVGDYPNYHQLGRETCLAPVRWDDKGWPVINENKPISTTMTASNLILKPWPLESTRDEFNNDTINFKWNFIRNPDKKNYSLSDFNGYLSMKCSKSTLDDNTISPTFLGRRQQHFNFIAETKLSFYPEKLNDEAGITMIMNSKFHYELAVKGKDKNRKIFFRYTLGNGKCCSFEKKIKNEPVKFKIEADINFYYFYYSLNNCLPKLQVVLQVPILESTAALMAANPKDMPTLIGLNTKKNKLIKLKLIII